MITAFAPILLTNTASSGEQLSGIAAWAVSLMESLGGFGIAILIALENLFPPIPSEVILPLAGFTAAQGTKFGIVAAIIWATIGSLVGAILLYLIARLFGRERTRWVMSKLPLMKIEDVDKTEAFFHKYDRPTVFFGRMLPIFRSLISMPAGVIKMNIPLFLALTAVGSAIWNSVLIGAGYALGDNWSAIQPYVDILKYILIAVIALAAITWIAMRIYRNRKGMVTDVE
ncbi:MAG: DedA family protein [Arcanobacterium sp.]|nr:DedA family protein [Arcanobacterium sp.]